MKYFILNPKMRDSLKSLVGDAPTLSAALTKYVSTWSFIMDIGFDQRYLSVSGNKRIRKKKLKAILKRAFIEEFLDCMDEVELSKEESTHIQSDLGIL